jgi:hypothetical protein
MTISVEEALRSEELRLRDRQLARWCGLPPNEVDPFLRRLRIFDARTEAWEIRMAREASKGEAAR